MADLRSFPSGSGKQLDLAGPNRSMEHWQPGKESSVGSCEQRRRIHLVVRGESSVDLITVL